MSAFPAHVLRVDCLADEFAALLRNARNAVDRRGTPLADPDFSAVVLFAAVRVLADEIATDDSVDDVVELMTTEFGAALRDCLNAIPPTFPPAGEAA